MSAHYSHKEHALNYARTGIAVIPVHYPLTDGQCSCRNINCKTVGKHPITKHGYKDASSKTEDIEGWCSQYPRANIGLPTGFASEFSVMDVDVKHGGLESLARIEKENGELPKTKRVRSGSGGVHLYFKPHYLCSRSNSNLLPGIDLRADGGYIIAPPSLHACGGRYELESDSSENLAEMPYWLAMLLGTDHRPHRIRQRSQTKTQDGNNFSEKIPEGGRTNFITYTSGYFFAKRIDPYLALEAVLALNEAKCDPPLPEELVRKTVNNIAACELRKRNGQE